MEMHPDKMWKVIFGTLCAIIVALIAGIIAVKNLNQKLDEHENETETSLVEQAQAEIADLNAVNISEAIRIYQTYIDVADGETKIELYNRRIKYILENDANRELGEQVIEDQIAIDDILQTIDSAVQVMNILYYYGDYGERLDKYNYIIRQREEAEGIDPNMETVG